MATTEVFYNGDNSDVTFTIPFEYLEESDVKVSVGGTLQTQDTDYTFSTLTEITFTTAPPTGVNNVRIFRDTDIDSGVRNEFFAGSAIRAQDLNDDFLQVLYSAQEIEDQFVTKFDGEFDTNVDMNSNRITDMADPVNAQDAVTKQYLEDNYFDDGTETIVAAETWPDNDTTIATTAAIDNRVDSKIDTAIENDVLVNNTGLTKSATGGQVTLGIAANSVDFDRIKDSDKITLSEQESDNDQVGTDDQIFTAQAATRRFNNYYQNDAPTATDGIGVGQVWVDPNDDLTLSVWTGSAWSAITSGGTFSNQPKVVYVDAGSGDDSNDGHRISRPKKTIRAALSDINGDADGDGSIVSVAPGIYAETLPLDIEKNDVGIIGQSLRTCIIHPLIPEADRDAYDVDSPHSQELQTMFRVNSGSYFQNLTLTGLKASGTRGASGSLYTDSTHGLPPNQGWNFAFLPNATIKKSPYIQNCTNFSDSQINNVPANFSPHVPGEGAAGDLDSAPTGGGILVDGSVPATASPLRSMVCDSYTHTALDGPGIFVPNNGYAQCTSSYAFFNHAHITCLNGGQANLAASTTDFGRFALVADGKSPTAIFTSNVDGAAADEATTFNINAPTAASDWFGDATRPANNMLVTVNSVTYPVLSATPRTDSEGGAGFTVEISRPSTSDRSVNEGLDGAVSDNAAVSFFLRSMIASSGHTMEYVGSGTNYTALPENGGVPIDSNQIIEKNDGKVWTAITDHKGTFKVGDFFTVDQQAGTLAVDSGSFKVDLGTLEVNVGGDAVVGANLDMGTKQITTSSGALQLNAASTGGIDVNSNKIINVGTPTADGHAATKQYVDDNTFAQLSEDTAPTLGGNLNVSTFEIISSDNRDITIDPHGTGDIVLEAEVGIGTSAPDGTLHVHSASAGSVTANAGADDLIVENNGDTGISILAADGNNTSAIFFGNATDAVGAAVRWNHNSNEMQIGPDKSGAHLRFNSGDGAEQMRVDSSGRLLVGTSSSRDANFNNASGVDAQFQIEGTSFQTAFANIVRNSNDDSPAGFALSKSRGTSAGSNVVVQNDDKVGEIAFQGSDGSKMVSAADIECQIDGTPGSADMPGRLIFSTNGGGTGTTERMRIDSSGRLLVGTISAIDTGATSSLQVVNTSTAIIALGRNDSSISTGNDLGAIRFYGNDGGTYQQCAEIIAEADGDHANDDKPTKLVFSTTADGHSSTTPRMQIDSAGNLSLGVTGALAQQAKFRLSTGSSAPSAEFHGVSGNYVTFSSGAIDSEAVTGFIGNANQLVTGGAVEDLAIRGQRHLSFSTGGNTERMRIDSSGRVLIGTDSNFVRGNLQVVDNGGGELLIARNDTSVDAGNDIGHIFFGSNDSPTGSVACASISCFGSITHSTGSSPTSLTFSTTPTGSNTASERMRIHNTGNVSFNNGIVLGAGVNDTAANTLDDYEEGTYDPVFSGSTTAGTYTYATRTGHYTKIGDMVNVTVKLTNITTDSAGAGNININLPFASADNGSYACGSVVLDQFNVASTTVSIAVRNDPNTAVLEILTVRDDTTDSALEVTDKSSNSADIFCTISYRVA